VYVPAVAEEGQDDGDCDAGAEDLIMPSRISIKSTAILSRDRALRRERTAAPIINQSSASILRMMPARTYRRRPRNIQAMVIMTSSIMMRSGPWVSGLV
jgi:hypothetical protein